MQGKYGTLFQRSLLTGFIGGLFWGALWIFIYYFNLSHITPKSALLKSWIKAKWVNGWFGDVTTIVMLGIISTSLAIIYFIFFKKIYSLWIGVAYGIIVWFLIFYIIRPLMTVHKVEFATNVSLISLFILYGAFIGYSISYDYFDTRVFNNEENVKK